MLEYSAIAIIISSVFVYSFLLMIECGATIFAATPRLLGEGGGEMVSAYIGPLWETTNVFLVFGFVSLVAFFPRALPVWGHALIVPFFVFLVVMIIRAMGMLYVFYHNDKKRSVNIVLVVAAIALPVVLAGGIVTYFVAGNMPYWGIDWLLAFDLGGFALATTLFLSFSFFEYLASRRGVRTTPSLDLLTSLFALCFILFSFFFLLMLPVVAPHIAANLNGSFPVLAGLSILEVILLMPPYRRYKGCRFAVATALFAVVFFGISFAQLPYLVYPSVTLAGAFTDAATARTMFIVFGIGAAVILPSLFFLYYLFAYRRK